RGPDEVHMQRARQPFVPQVGGVHAAGGQESRVLDAAHTGAQNAHVYSAPPRPTHRSPRSITVIPPVVAGPAIATSARPAPDSPITDPTSRSGRSDPFATSAIIGG